MDEMTPMPSDEVLASEELVPAVETPKQLTDLVPNFEKIEGWLNISDAKTLFQYAAEVNHGCIVEIGSYRGRSTVALCAGSKVGSKCPVFAVEPHDEFTGVKGTSYGPRDRGKFFRTMLATNMTKIVRVLNTTSGIVSGHWQQPVNLLFIDGDRRYDGVREDFASWYPYLIPGAVVIFKDPQDEGPARMIEELISAGVLRPERKSPSLQVLKLQAPASRAERMAIKHRAAPALGPEIVIDPEIRQDDLTDETVAYHVYYGNEGKYLYQSIPKCACTSIKTILLELEGLPIDENEWMRHDKGKNQFPGVSHLTLDEQRKIFQGGTDTFKFVIVRDPYTRMTSVYQDKIAMVTRKRSRHWTDLIRHAATEQGIELSENISFEEFVRVASAQPLEAMDAHWRPQYFEGRFNYIKFDYIGHLEMLSSDMAYILERLDAPAHLFRSIDKPHNVTGAAMAMWTGVSSEVRSAFLKTYAIDFDTLRYPFRYAMQW
jgi:predicted O-methyltransferase YrrM